MATQVMALIAALTTSASGYNLYPLLPADAMSQLLGISSGCLSMLNKTLPCDNDRTPWAFKFDEVYWEEEDVTSLCTTQCISMTQRWRTQVEEACANDWIRSGQRFVPAHSLSGRIVEGISMACMQSSSKQWCLLESYEWTGSDVVQIDCDANPADPWCMDRGNFGKNQSRMSTLYDDDLLCSECFLKVLYGRVTSEFLQDTDYAEYLVEEFQDVQSVCKTTVGPLATRSAPIYPELDEAALIGRPTSTPSATTPSPTPTPTATTCTGRMLDLRPDPDEFLTCDDIAERYNIATGDVAVYTKSVYCKSQGEVCVPSPCEVYLVRENDTCASIAESLSNTTVAVSLAQLAAWNPNILGACDHLALGQFVCVGPPGGAWIPPANIPDNGEGPIRGGPGSTVSLPIINNPQDVPSDRVQEGIPADCNRWIVANNTQAACWKLANDAKITTQRLFELNPVLGENGENCATQVWLSYYYCIGRSGDGTTPTPTPSSPVPSVTGSPKPTQTQAGIASNCVKFEKAVSGDGCWGIADRAGVPLSDFYKWNTVLGTDGGQCTTQIWPDYYYCVGVAATATSARPTTTSSAPLPTKTQAGFATNCKKWVEAKSGDSCWALGNDNSVALDVLYRLNPALGDNGANCGTALWPEYFYCLAT